MKNNVVLRRTVSKSMNGSMKKDIEHEQKCFSKKYFWQNDISKIKTMDTSDCGSSQIRGGSINL